MKFFDIFKITISLSVTTSIATKSAVEFKIRVHNYFKSIFLMLKLKNHFTKFTDARRTPFKNLKSL